MNVDMFAKDPSLSWYFVTSIPFMIVILIVVVFLRFISFSRVKRQMRRALGRRVDVGRMEGQKRRDEEAL